MKKCGVCNKSLLISSGCLCGGIFCLKHRYPLDHNCKFNFTEYFKSKHTAENPKVIADKLNRI